VTAWFPLQGCYMRIVILFYLFPAFFLDKKV
jgi:hypothetical protein